MEFFVEILTEELPASEADGFEKTGRDYFDQLFKKTDIISSPVKFMFTPRRIAVTSDIIEHRKKRVKQIRGPRSPLMKDGKFTVAASGFARGLKIEPDALIEKDGSIYAEKKSGGEPVEQFFPKIIRSFISEFPFKKRMRWTSGEITFARPIHQIVCFYNGKKIDAEINEVPTKTTTVGHRFLSSGTFEVKNFAQYNDELKKRFVVLENDDRKQLIKKQVNDIANQFGGSLLSDESLVVENAALVEYPFTIGGNFNREFLQLPKEVLITSMKNHQRFFAVIDEKNAIMPYFAAISNMPASYTIREGFERVLSARFNDAMFFFNEDTSVPFESYYEKLSSIVFHKSLGSMEERVERIGKIALILSEKTGLSNKNMVKRAALLSKNDLVTEMVGEFPELQGIMGRIYADEEENDVSSAIEEQYLPKGKILPKTETGAVLALANNFELLISVGSVEMPTSSKDPYGLRRAAIGIIKILLAKNIDLDTDEISNLCYDILTNKKKNSINTIKRFFNDRFRGILIDRGIRYDIADAVCFRDDKNQMAINCFDAYNKAKAIDDFLKVGNALIFKRIAHIVPDDFKAADLNRSKMSAIEEELDQTYNSIVGEFNSYENGKEYLKSLSLLSNTSDLMDRFFDKVMVLDEDPALRCNRLTLLCRFKTLQDKIANFDKINI